MNIERLYFIGVVYIDMSSFDKEVPSVGDVVRVTNTESGEIVAENEVQNVQRYRPGSEPDDAVYMELLIEEDNLLMFKWGYWDDEQYSWGRTSNYGGPEITIGENCFNYEIL